MYVLKLLLVQVSARIRCRAEDLFSPREHPDDYAGKSDRAEHPNQIKTSLQSLYVSRASSKCVNMGCTSVLSLSQHFVYEQPRVVRELIPPSASCPCGSLRFMEPHRFPSSPAPSCKITRQYGSSRPSPLFEIQKFLFGESCL